MSREQNLATQQLLGDIVNAGEFDRLGEVFAPDVVDHDPAPDQGPGVEGFQSFFRGLAASFPDAQVAVDTTVADDEQVAIAYRISGTHEGEFQGVAPTGQRFEARALQVARFRDGKIVERWGATDLLGVVQQLGGAVQS